MYRQIYQPCIEETVRHREAEIFSPRPGGGPGKGFPGICAAAEVPDITGRQWPAGGLSDRAGKTGQLLAVCDFYAGELFAVHRGGLAFRIVHIRNELEHGLEPAEPYRSRTLHIFSHAAGGYLLKNLGILSISDTCIGPVYRNNDRILRYRREVELQEGLSASQLEKLLDAGAAAEPAALKQTFFLQLKN